jgi:hypothetical protein
MAGLFTYATMTKTLEEHKNKGKITHINILENVFEGQTLDMLAYQTLGFFFFFNQISHKLQQKKCIFLVQRKGNNRKIDIRLKQIWKHATALRSLLKNEIR